MKLRERFKLDRLRPPKNRGPFAYIKRKLHPQKTLPNRHLSIFLNTYCNLKCFSCAALGMPKPPPPIDTKIENIELFLRHAAKIYPGSYIMLTGGEPTMYPRLGEACHLIHEYGFKTAMLTNGYRMVPAEWFDFILLDYHGVNDDKMIEWQKTLKASNIKWDIRMKQYHQDIQVAMKGNITRGARCSNWLEPLTLLQNVVYPCCNLMCVEWWHDTDEVTTALIDAGWTVDNPGLVGAIKNWRETLPSTVYQLCMLGCWRDADKANWRQIEHNLIA